MAKKYEGPSEHEIQASFFQWIDIHKEKYQGLNYFFAIPNGSNKSPAARMKFKREGLRSGVPDVCCPCPSIDGKYLGLWLEFKRPGVGSLTNPQALWIDALKRIGHHVEIVRSWTDAANLAAEHFGYSIKV
jgi:hypothetical protein